MLSFYEKIRPPHEENEMDNIFSLANKIQCRSASESFAKTFRRKWRSQMSKTL